jgi:hypothetical protein
MTPFYRYVRPVKLNEQRLELETVPHGGVCLRFDEAPDGTLLFTHARCHHEELFSKAVAKRVADQRANNRRGLVGQPAPPTVPMAMDPATLTAEVIKACVAWDPAWFDMGENFYMTYMKLELHELKSALEHLVASNRREQAKAEIWKAGLAAARHGERYESLSR